jgi:hypothetical protein
MLRRIHKQPIDADMFVHRNAWFNLCDFIYSSKDDQWAPKLENTSICNTTEEIFPGAMIFITPWGATEFARKIHPSIKNPYLVISWCYGPVYSIKDCVDDPKVIAWFGQANSEAINFDKFTLVPVGLFGTNEVFENSKQLNKSFEQWKNNDKQDLLYLNFKVHKGQHATLGNREYVYNLFSDKQYCKTITLTHEWRKPFDEYMEEMSKYKFALSPQGDQHEAYRHWEAMIVGSVPIIQKSPLDKIFDDLPVIIVDDYSEISEDFLYRKYDEMKNKQYNNEKLYMKYWMNKINQAKTNYGI